MDDSAIYTVAEAARISRVSERTYYAAARRGEVPATRIGRRLVVSGAALRRFLEGGDGMTNGRRTNTPPRGEPQDGV